MLARNFRFTIQNNLGDSVAQNNIEIESRKWKGSDDGTVAFEAAEESVYLMDATVLNDAGWDSGAAFDNSGTGDEWEGGDFELYVKLAAGTYDGTVDVYYEPSTDAGSQFADNGEGHLVCVFAIATTLTGTTTATFYKSFSL